MSHVALLMLQVASAGTPAPPPPSAANAALLHPVPPANCLARAQEIVVCGKDGNTYRLPQTGSVPDVAGPPKAEWKLFGDVKAGVGFQQRNVGGIPSNAVMATIKIPF